MAAARLSVILILIPFLQGSLGQLGLGNKPDLTYGPLTTAQQALQRKADLISNPINLNQIPKSANIGPNLLQQQLYFQQHLNSQQPLNYQQSLNLQQSQNVPIINNMQQPLLNQNLQQSQLQQQNALQQQLLQQQLNSLPVTNLQSTPQQASLPARDVSLSSIPMVNSQVSRLPSQMSQGLLHSSLGLTSSLPSLLPNSCPNNHVTDLISAYLSQGNAASLSNIPISVYHTNSLPVSSSPFNAVTNPSTSIAIPLSPQNIRYSQQSQPSQNQFSLKSIHLKPLTSLQSQPVAASVQSQPSPSSFIIPLNPNSQIATNYPAYSLNSIPQAPNHGSSSSSIKALLPFLINLLKDKGSCCGCHSNNSNKCGCVNNSNNNDKYNVIEPQVFGGYSNQVNYSTAQKTEAQKEESSNTVDSEEFEGSENIRRRRKHRRYKNKHDSEEYADEDVSDYDDDD